MLEAHSLLSSGKSARFVGFDPINRNSDISLSTGIDVNSDVTRSVTNGWSSVRAILGRRSGRFAWEVHVLVANVDDTFTVGATDSTTTLTSSGTWIGNVSPSAGCRSDNNVVGWTKAQTGAPSFAGTAGDVYMFAWNGDAGYLWCGKNGVWSFSSDPAAGTNPWVTGATGIIYPAVSIYTGLGTSMVMRIRTRKFQMRYQLPAGFAPWAGS